MNILIFGLSVAFGASAGVMMAGGSSAYLAWVAMFIVGFFICAWEA